MNAQLKAVLQQLEAEDLQTLSQLLVPAVLAEVQDISKANGTASAIEAAIFPAIEPALQSAFASLIAKIPSA